MLKHLFLLVNPNIRLIYELNLILVHPDVELLVTSSERIQHLHTIYSRFLDKEYHQIPLVYQFGFHYQILHLNLDLIHHCFETSVSFHYA